MYSISIVIKPLQLRKEVLNKPKLSCYHQIRDIRRV